MEGLDVEVFNFDDPANWDRVMSVKDDPIAVTTLKTGIQAICRSRGEAWTRDTAPWQFTAIGNPNRHLLEQISPDPASPHWYRAFGYCHCLSPWCAVIGSLIYPDYDWVVAYNPSVPDFDSHSAGVGIDIGSRSLIILDLVWGEPTLHNDGHETLTRILFAPNAYSVSHRAATRWLSLNKGFMPPEGA